MTASLRVAEDPRQDRLRSVRGGQQQGWRRRRLAAALALAAGLVPGLALTGCQRSTSKPQFSSVDVTGADWGRELALTDHAGKPHRLADDRGKVVAVFFGYTQCPDVCPTTMAELAGVMKQLGNEADRVRVLFITVDPERDTQELLSQYVPAFDPRFLGLRGTPEETMRTMKEFKAFAQKVPGKTAGSYTVDHSAGTYLFDPQGRLRLFVRYGAGTDVFVHDIRLLLAEAAAT